MVVVAYVLSFILFPIVYVFTTFIFVALYDLVRTKSRPRNPFAGFRIVYAAGISTYLGLYSVLSLFRIFDYTANWWILVPPMMILIWVWINRSIYTPSYEGMMADQEKYGFAPEEQGVGMKGGALWGLFIGVVLFLAIHVW